MRRPVRLLGIAAAVAVGLTVAFLWRGATDDSRAPEQPRAPFSVLGRIEPRVHGIGDRVFAEVVVVTDTTIIDPDTIRPRIDYEPYDRIAPVQRMVSKSGSVARFSWRYPLMCLVEECTPSDETPTIQLPFGSVAYRYRDAPRPIDAEVRWPEIELVTRVAEAEVTAGAWRVDAAAITPLSLRASPGVLAAALFAGALALLALAAALTWQLVGRREAEAEEEVVDARPPLERALEAAQVTSLNGALPERRKALERVARELSQLGHDDLASRARTLAWSARSVSADAIEDLVRAARTAALGGA